jgi:peptide/nickel transport system permease protein
MTSVMPVRRSARLSRRTAGWGMAFGALLAVAAVLMSLLGPLLAPYSPTASVGVPGLAGGDGHLLGLDMQGRDVLTRVLYGGRSTLLLGAAATLCTYAIGIAIGLLAGFVDNLIDPLLMRTMDVLLSIPALLVMLLMATGLGSSPAVLVLGAVLVLAPGVSRIVRAATQEVAGRGYVEAAVARGERTFTVLRREILPNIASPIMADLGIRFSWSIILIASVNFLGLGIRPPTPDWGVMISENRVIIPTNPMAVVAPSLMLAVLVVAVNLLGDGLVRRFGRRGGS